MQHAYGYYYWSNHDQQNISSTWFLRLFCLNVIPLKCNIFILLSGSYSGTLTRHALSLLFFILFFFFLFFLICLLRSSYGNMVALWCVFTLLYKVNIRYARSQWVSNISNLIQEYYIGEMWWLAAWLAHRNVFIFFMTCIKANLSQRIKIQRKEKSF